MHTSRMRESVFMSLSQEVCGILKNGSMMGGRIVTALCDSNMVNPVLFLKQKRTVQCSKHSSAASFLVFSL